MPTESPENDAEKLRTQQSFEVALNRHGYGFQFRVLEEASKAGRSISRWRFLAAEVPVEVRSAGTRIDFILEYSSEMSGYRDLMICECKRVNPAFHQWCFIRAPRMRRNTVVEALTVETVKRIGNVTVTSSGAEGFQLHRGSVYHLALPVKGQLKGDDRGSNDGIEGAVTQVLRGMNGYVNLLGKNPQALEDRTTSLLPVVFTTADLWATDADLSKADLASGDMDLSGGTFQKLPWLWFQYSTSPGIKHSFSPGGRPAKIETLIGSEFIRTVAIVNYEGIRDFLEFTTDNILR